MDSAGSFESLFKQAVFAIDAGDVTGLKRLLDEHPDVATSRLYSPGSRLTEQIGDALNGFFKDLIWAEYGKRSEIAAYLTGLKKE